MLLLTKINIPDCNISIVKKIACPFCLPDDVIPFRDAAFSKALSVPI